MPSRAGKTEKTRLAWVPVRSHLLGLGIVLLGGSGGGHGGGALPLRLVAGPGGLLGRGALGGVNDHGVCWKGVV